MLKTSSTDSPLPVTDLSLETTSTLRLEADTKATDVQTKADLVFTQDSHGQYLSFYWRGSEYHQLNPQDLVHQALDQVAFKPVAIAPYLQRIQYALRYALPQQFDYPFQIGNHCLLFSLVVSPVLVSRGNAKTVVVSGQFIGPVSDADAQEAIQVLDQQPQSTVDPVHYKRMLAQIARHVRRRLDLDAIWQKTVDGLGDALGLSRCLIFPYKPEQNTISVAAEFPRAQDESCLGASVTLEDHQGIGLLIHSAEPVVFPATNLGWGDEVGTVVAIATRHKDQINGIITLHQPDPAHQWSDLELELLQNLADQIGLDIAQATLLAESQSLADELQHTNDRLRQKHQELEEAHQQAEEASRLKSQFLANTSHELRTPLNGMIGFLKLVLDGMADDPEEQNEFIEEAHRSAVHLLNIINDILDIAKIEAGKMQLDLDPVNLDDFMADVESFTRPQAQQKSLTYEIVTPSIRDPIILFGNYQRLLQVMLNLVGNSVKFTHEGGITISAEIIKHKVTVQGQDCPGMAKISVADTGIGVSLEKQDRLFQNFSQIDGSRTRQYGGTGLGLAISQKLVEAMGGVMNFFSLGEGLGATVTFTVPLFQEPIMVAADNPNPSA